MIVKVYPASNGDAILIKIDRVNILIDGGYVNTFNNYIKKDLLEIASSGGKLSHVIISHIDQDHISGIVKLFESNENDDLIAIDNVWHNSYRHLQLNRSLERSKPADFPEELAASSYLKEINEEEQPVSGKQGSSLASCILKGNYSWNAEFSGRAVNIDVVSTIQIGDDIKILLLSPDQEKLEKLEKTWRKELRKEGYLRDLDEDVYYDDAFEFIMAKLKEAKRLKEKNVASGPPNIETLLVTPFEEDQAAPNGSSIAFVLEYGNKKLLFLGDAHPCLIEKSLRMHYNNFPVNFDLIKTSHHGSWSNNSPDLLGMIDSQRFVFSTNGKGHNHPDEETIAHIISRKTESTRQLYINYPSTTLSTFNDDKLKKEFNFTVEEGNGHDSIIISIEE